MINMNKNLNYDNSVYLMTDYEKKRHEFRLKVIKLKQDDPSLSIQELADLTESSYGKTYSVIRTASDLGIVGMLQTGPKPGRRSESYKSPYRTYSTRRTIDVEEVLQIREDNPTITLQAIGERMGCSRERIRQILSANDPNYNADNTVALRANTHRNCRNCNTFLDSHTYARKRGTCNDCRKQQLFEKNNKEYICAYCEKPFIISEVQYNHRLRGKRKYADKAQSTEPLTGITCSYTCASRQRGFGTHVRGIRGKGKKNVHV